VRSQKNTVFGPAILLVAGLVLAGCAVDDADDTLTESFPFTGGLVCSSLIDCQEHFEEAITFALA
jgi:hypothetical protein